MSSYEPYLIAPLKEALDLGMEPWLTPSGAFRTLLNAYVRRGVLQKRQGKTLWGRVVHAVASEAIGASGSTTYTGTLANVPIRPGDLEFTDETLVIADDGDGTLSGDGTGTIDYTTGVYSITFSGATSDAVTADYDFYPGLPIVSIDKFQTNAGTLYFLISDTKRINLYDAITGKLEDLTGTDEFTGNVDNYFWTEIHKDVFYMTNNTDAVMSFDGSTLADLLIDTDGDADTDVTACLLILAHKERIILLNTTEGGSTFAQRARWCSPVSAGVAPDFSNDEYADAPTGDWITSAGFIGEDLVVWFEHSIWKLKYTADSTAPFRWELITAADGPGPGCFAPFSMWSNDESLIAVGPTNIITTDGFTARQLNAKVPDIVIDMDRDKMTRAYSISVEEKGLTLLAYPTVGAAGSDEVLAINYEETSWSKFDWAMNCFGYYVAEDDPTWDEVELTWDEWERSWDERTSQAGFPITLGGDESGNIWQLFDSGADDGAAIELVIESGQWNPFSKEGQMAKLGYLDFLVDRDAGVSFLVEFFVDDDPTAYYSETVVCDSENNVEEKVWKRVFPGGEVGSFHKVKISHTAASQTLKLHALMPWFRRSGRLHA